MINNVIVKTKCVINEIDAAKLYNMLSVGKNITNNVTNKATTTTNNATNKATNKATNISKKLTNKLTNIDKRIKFPQVFRNAICYKQKWRCNCCNKLLPESIIVDHMVPLFLQGTNNINNLQAICPGCDKFKTSYLDYQILKPLLGTSSLTSINVYNLMIEHYNKTIAFNDNKTNSNNIFRYLIYFGI